MIVKRNFRPDRVLGYVYREMLVALGASLLVFAGFAFGEWQLSLPFSVAGILGSSLAIFIAFRNNSSYGRWWEARTLWGGIVNSSRVLARLIITFADSHAHQPGYNQEKSEAFKQEMVRRCIGWVHALRLHLRKTNSWDELKAWVPAEEYAALAQAQNKPNYLQLLIGRQIYQAMAGGTLGGFDSFQMEGQMLALAQYQGACERIKNTPLLRQYDYFTRLFLYAFLLILPLALVRDFGQLGWIWATVPVSVLIAFVFAIMSKVGEVNEDPFENRITDVPMTALCNTIERDLLEMLGEKTLPAQIEIQDGYLF